MSSEKWVSDGYSEIYADNGRYVAITFDSTFPEHKTHEQIKADARLIAAAPELLEALRSAEAALADIGDADREHGDDVAWCERRAAEALPAVRAAIAKVKKNENAG